MTERSEFSGGNYKKVKKIIDIDIYGCRCSLTVDKKKNETMYIYSGTQQCPFDCRFDMYNTHYRCAAKKAWPSS